MKKNKIFIYVIIVSVAVLSIFIYISVNKKSEHAGHITTVEEKQQYHCPMHPTYISDKPGDCPICGMKLVPMEKSDESDIDTTVSGQSTITISPEKEQLIGVKTAVVAKRRLTLSIRATGRVAHDPELYNAIVEYQRTLTTIYEIKKNNTSSESLKQTEALLKSSYIKLQHLGLSEAQIKEISKDTAYPTNLIFVGKPGGTVWVYIQIYEYEIGLVKRNQKVEISSVSLPGKKYYGVVKSVDTYLDMETRSLRVRAEISNKEGLLKPEMFVDAVIIADLGEKISIPEDAVLDSGIRKIIFVKKDKGKYEPREVQLGHEADGYYEVISGVNESEEIVTSANFLIDSESKLKSAISGMGEHKH